MKLAAVIVLSIIVVVLAAQIYAFWGKDRKAAGDFNSFKAQLDAAKADEAKSQADLNYYLNPANLEKELRARFNYRAPDEKLLILVPRNASSVASSTSGNR